MSGSVVAIAGGVAGALLIAAALISLMWFCRSKHPRNRNSETGSSDPSALAEWNRGGPSGSTARISGPRQFSLEELEQATKQFDDSNLIGYGSFGSVYKGLLRDGTVVAIKRRPGTPRLEFIAEVSYLLEIRHRTLVTLLGYCIESGFQMLVFEYLPNGSISNHLYYGMLSLILYGTKFHFSYLHISLAVLTETGQDPPIKLEFKRRISIALDAATGLYHLHSLKPPLLHRSFKTSNVLVDENFIAKVSDAGLSRLLERIEEAGPSSQTSATAFQDPEAGVSGIFSEMSDVYSFGVFLLELVTGVPAPDAESLGPHRNLMQWVESRQKSNNLVDRRLLGTFTSEGIRDFIRLALLCIVLPGIKRPKMDMIVLELERIREKEMALTTFMGEGTAIITPGSELFT
ncbi:probable leucine-rich repeat receptor-like protein kinase At5g49770 isoform X1 [Punica granatum]|uniref:non-specific serine/threonine protein kinase n=1 Tax=Punica granatum TaxID=22663 RepID=A0A6P8C2Z6_PUNGR|nr:probable leucine-rich repeat receptor-like protein kinase At5g49770 isoform X1 [Punica granatum]